MTLPSIFSDFSVLQSLFNLYFFVSFNNITDLDIVTVCQTDTTFKVMDDHAFLKQMSGCRAYASTAGFESICEAIYMGKPVLMVPAHIEQECNAYDAMCAGAGIISTSFSLDRLLEFSSTFHPNRTFIFWAHNVNLLIEHLIREPEPTPQSLYTEKILQLFKRYKPVFYKYLNT